jgi:hypothetical protein
MNGTKEFDPVERLRTQLGRMNAQFSQADVTNAMRMIRLVLDVQMNAAVSYPYLRLYCDWLLHTEIDRQRVVITILDQMNEALNKYDKDADGAVAAASHAMGFAALRSEIKSLFAANSIQAVFLLDSFANWNKFVTNILEDLCQRPIRLPAEGKKTQEAIARMIERAKQKDRDNWMRAAWITLEHDENRPTFFWNIELILPHLGESGFVTLKSPLQLAETERDFFFP